MQDCSQYEIEDFVMDKSFRKWILESDVHSNLIWEEWLKNNSTKADDIREAREVLLSMARHDYKAPAQLQDEIWNNILDAEVASCIEPKVVPIGAHAVIGNYSNGKKHGFKNYWYAVAASLLILVGLGVFYSVNNGWDLDQEIALTTIEKVTSKGQKSTIHLPDGTKVFLNSLSSLSYQSNYNDTDRRVTLTGEAFFEVAKDATRPFVVETKHLNTTALGTSFNVKAASRLTCHVSLHTGKVKVELNGKHRGEEFLLPGEEVNYQFGDDELEKEDFDIETAALWRKGIIYLDETSFKETIELLEHWYGVTFMIEGDLPDDLECTGRFENDYLSNVLSGLGYALDFQYRIEGKEVHLTFSSQNPSL
ncbi:MAG: FecR domain-containing protein [Cyclobacteriaceae bacterium]